MSNTLAKDYFCVIVAVATTTVQSADWSMFPYEGVDTVCLITSTPALENTSSEAADDASEASY
eukprot:9135-Heterococcus_DN1.PRE.7